MVRRQVFNQEGHAWRWGAVVEIKAELGPFKLEVVEVDAAHPARQRLKVQALGRDHRVDRHPALAGGIPFAPHQRRVQRSRCHHEDQDLDLVERLEDLQPPVSAAFHALAVTPQRYSIFQQACPQVAGDGLAVAAGVGQKGARRSSVGRQGDGPASQLSLCATDTRQRVPAATL